jgi:DNA helicase HerA-like ATPase
MELENNDGLVFTLKARRDVSIFDKIKRAVQESKVIIIDTNLVGDEAEKLIASSVVSKIFNLYRRTKQSYPEKFKTLPELLLVFEEAPRVLGASAGSNIFGTVAREGRKFKVGLCAITQMPSLLPREVLSQMNTKVILGLPAPADRDAVINSSSQEIGDESTEIQMLDTGEAIITSPFVQFPIPVKVDYFNDIIKQGKSIFQTRGIG